MDRETIQYTPVENGCSQSGFIIDMPFQTEIGKLNCISYIQIIENDLLEIHSRPATLNA